MTIRGLTARAQVARQKANHLAWRYSNSGRANQRRIRSLSGKYAGQRCVVMGNGPSLLTHDLNRLRHEITIVSNAHYLIWDRLQYVPTFITVEDTLVAEDRAEELRALNNLTKIFPCDLNRWLGAASENTLYLNFVRKYRSFPRFSLDLSRRAYWGGTVSFLNLQLAAFLGCNPIVMIGFDHSYVVPSNPGPGHVIHSADNDVNHIHPDYFGPGYRWHDPNVARMEKGYQKASATLSSVGIEVLNATAEGRLEIFPRVPFDSLFGAPR